jgi:UDP-N-acetyl-D-mannosaminuronic acid transferase (WecB/TagA/CpsF family)
LAGFQVTIIGRFWVTAGGKADNLIAAGTVERPPEWLSCKGSRWVLRIDQNGVRHESDLQQPHVNE